MINKDNIVVGTAGTFVEYNNKTGISTPMQTAPIGVKYDSDKVRMDLLMVGCAKSLDGVAKVLTFGANKYADDNWREVPNFYKRYNGALHRHLNAYYRGEKVDSETGLSHLYHALCCLHFLAELES